ncbi:MAG: hypothetical protein WC471_03225 [Candidatus Woesearchaeota archaeon]
MKTTLSPLILFSKSDLPVHPLIENSSIKRTIMKMLRIRISSLHSSLIRSDILMAQSRLMPNKIIANKSHLSMKQMKELANDKLPIIR